MKRFFLLIISLLAINFAHANEGMWLPFLLNNNIGEMSEMGLHLSADDIYNINQSCLKDAVIGFIDLDRPFSHFCSGSVISAQGLIITNHHCGLSVVQQHSSPQNDYITNGFWANQFSDELGGNDIGVSFLRRMEDVTAQVLEGVNDTMTTKRRNQVIKSNIAQIEAAATEGTHYQACVDNFYCGNEYYLSVYEVFEDIRLVGTPPISIGKFGGDTDNWVWPRHTGDFTLFRIYADSTNKPAKYSENNIPYKPASHLKINIQPKKEGDFAMVMGYPGTTREYLPSFTIEAIRDIYDPIVVNVRGKAIDIIKHNMRNSNEVMIKYTSKVAQISNAWKKLQGESNGLRTKRVVEHKQMQEHEMKQWIAADTSRQAKYGLLIDDYNHLYAKFAKLERDRLYMAETLLKSEVIAFVQRIRNTIGGEDKTAAFAEAQKLSNDFFTNYDLPTDMAVTTMLFEEFVKNCNLSNAPKQLNFTQKQTAEFVKKLYSKTLFTDSAKVLSLLKNHSSKNEKALKSDPLYKLTNSIVEYYQNNITKPQSTIKRDIDELQRRFMLLQREFFANKNLFPDANSTLRYSFGEIKGFAPADGVYYHPFTTLDGIVEKSKMEVYDYIVPDKLIALNATKDFGRYAAPDSTLQTCFTTTCHTTGGNSGSPIFNGYGHLIGLNFDRVWEGTMSDLQFDAEICRNIGVDIRYVLFVIDKFAGANHIIDELDIIN